MYDFFVALAKPIPIGLILSWVVMWRLRRQFPEARRRVTLLFLLSLFIAAACLPVTGVWLESLLESPYRDKPVQMRGVKAIVVLSAWIRESDQGGWFPDWRSAERCRLAASLYKQQPCKVIVCGGKVHDGDPGPTYAARLGEFLLTLGIRKQDLVLEEKSRNTYENVAEATRLLQDARGKVVVVTTASHLLRADRCFAKQGVDVQCAGCNFSELEMKVSSFVPGGNGAEITDGAVHEVMGIIWYWLRGRI